MKHNKLLITCILALPILLSACGGGSGSNTTKTETINGITVPPAPDPVVNNATLAGVDSNNNGVRDDVERKIAEVVTNPQDFQQAIKEAQYYQLTLEKPKSKNESLSLAGKIICAENENSTSISGGKLLNEILTNEERRKANREYARSAGAFLATDLPACN